MRTSGPYAESCKKARELLGKWLARIPYLATTVICFPTREMVFSDMRLIARGTLMEFGERYPAARASLAHWMSVTKAAKWTTIADIVTSFSKAKALNGERVRFEVAGGDYRMIIAFDFSRGIAFVKFIGTHAEYDRIDALTVSRF